MDHHHVISNIKPLILSVLGVSIIDINPLLGTVSLALSIVYTSEKFYKDFKTKK